MYEKIKQWLIDKKVADELEHGIPIMDKVIELIGVFAREQCKLQQQADIKIAEYYNKGENKFDKKLIKLISRAIANKIAFSELVIDVDNSLQNGINKEE